MSDEPKNLKQAIDDIRGDLSPLRKDGNLYDELVDLRADERRAGMSELKPCCVCSSDWNHEGGIVDTLYPSNRDTETGEFVEWNVVCQLHNTGCGRTVYAKSKDEAIRRWNQGLTDETMDW